MAGQARVVALLLVVVAYVGRAGFAHLAHSDRRFPSTPLKSGILEGTFKPRSASKKTQSPIGLARAPGRTISRTCGRGQQLCGPDGETGKRRCCPTSQCCGALCCPITWKVLTLILPYTDFSWFDDFDNATVRVQATMTEEQMQAATDYARSLPATVRQLSAGRLDLRVRVKRAQDKLTAMTFIEDGYFPAPGDVQHMVEKAVHGEVYDCIWIFYRADSSDVLSFPPPTVPTSVYGRGGCCFYDDIFEGGAGYVGIVLPTWNKDIISLGDPILAHEFGHVLEAFYGNRDGVGMPCLHCSADFGYPGDDHMEPSWLEDFYAGKIWDPSLQRYVGLNATVYGFGTPSRPSTPPPWDPAVRLPPFPPQRSPFPPPTPPSPPPPPRPPFPPAPPRDMPAARAVYGNSTYEGFSWGANWTTAQAFCASRGGHLASVSGPEEGQVVRDVAQRAAMGFNLAFYRCVWIGLRCTPKPLDGGDPPLCVELGQYTRWSDTSSANYTEWAYPQPFNAGWHFPGVECACSFEPVFWLWRDDNCGSLNPFVCELPAAKAGG